MTQYRSLLAGAFTLTAMALSSVAVANVSEDDVKITDLVAFGSACKTDDQGKPQDYAFTLSDDGRTYSLDFSNFILDESKRSADCTIILDVDYPAGKTSYTFASQVRGEAEVKSGDSAVIETKVRLASGIWKTSSKTFAEGTDGDVETKVASNKDSKVLPCGTNSGLIVVKVSAKLTGENKSFLEVNSTDGRKSNIMIKTGDCE